MIRQYSLVVFDRSNKSDFEMLQYPSLFYDGEPMVFMGEIPNLLGFGIFQCKNHTYIGYKISDFIELSENDALRISLT